MEKEVIISVKTGEAVQNVAQLRENIKQYKSDLEGLDLTSQDYQDTLLLLKQNQDALRQSMYLTSDSLDAITQAAEANNIAFDDNNKLVDASNVSYNALVNTMGQMKQAWRSTTDAAERAKLGERINSINDQLKGMDASVGKFGRNVGNYVGAVDHLAGGLASMGGGARAIIAPLKGVTMGFQTLSATPAVAILGLLANILMAVIKALKTSEDNTQGLTAAMGPLRAIGDAVTKVFQGLGTVVVKVVEFFGKLTQAIFKNNEASEKRIELAQREAALAKQQRQTLMQNAEAERDIAELRAKASDRINYTSKQRLEFLKEAGALEEEVAQRALEQAQERYRILHETNQLTQSSKEDLDKEAQAYADMVKAETNYYNKMREINAGITTAHREETQALINENKAREDARKAELEAYRSMLQQEIEISEKGSEERLAKQKELLDLELAAAEQNARDKIKDQQTLDRTLVALRKKYHADIAKLDREGVKEQNAETLAQMRLDQKKLQTDSAEWWKAEVKIRRKIYADMQQEVGESDAAFQLRRKEQEESVLEAFDKLREKWGTEAKTRLAVQKATQAQTKENTLLFNAEMLQAEADFIQKRGRLRNESDADYAIRLANAQRAAADAWSELGDYQLDQERLALENRMNEQREGSFAYLSAAVDLKKFELDSLHKLEEESNEDFRARQLAAEKEYYNAQVELVQAYVSDVETVLGGVSDLMGSLADLYESNTEASAAEQRKAKNLRLAGAYIDMFSGVVTAIAQAQQLGPITGPIMAAINSAAVITAGMANINKIKATQVSTTNAPSASSAEVPAVVEAPTVTPAVQQFRNLTSATEEERLNRMADEQRVYILSSDLEADRDATRARVRETSF